MSPRTRSVEQVIDAMIYVRKTGLEGRLDFEEIRPFFNSDKTTYRFLNYMVERKKLVKILIPKGEMKVVTIRDYIEDSWKDSARRLGFDVENRETKKKIIASVLLHFYSDDLLKKKIDGQEALKILMNKIQLHDRPVQKKILLMPYLRSKSRPLERRKKILLLPKFGEDVYLNDALTIVKGKYYYYIPKKLRAINELKEKLFNG